MISWLPLPTARFPTQRMRAPTPCTVPSKVYLACGSYSAHGDQALKRSNESRVAKTCSGLRSITTLRSTCVVDGSSNPPATKTSPTATIAASVHLNNFMPMLPRGSRAVA